jgi:hypothetical protein
MDMNNFLNFILTDLTPPPPPKKKYANVQCLHIYEDNIEKRALE